jgi:chromosome segregation ATPase
LSNGPLSSTVKVPARPKPGRKTAVDEPTSKRKAQNRQAQRNFRQRKLEHAHGLETNNQELRAENQQLLVEIDRLTHAANESQQQASQFRNELEEWQSRYNDIEGRWSSSLNTMARVQELSRAAEDQSATWRRRYEAKVVEVDALEKKLAMLQRRPVTYRSGNLQPCQSTQSCHPPMIETSNPGPDPKQRQT